MSSAVSLFQLRDKSRQLRRRVFRSRVAFCRYGKQFRPQLRTCRHTHGRDQCSALSELSRRTFCTSCASCRGLSGEFVDRCSERAADRLRHVALGVHANWPSSKQCCEGRGIPARRMLGSDRAVATSVQRGLTALPKPPPECGAICLGRISIDSSRHRTGIWPARLSRHRWEFATLNGCRVAQSRAIQCEVDDVGPPDDARQELGETESANVKGHGQGKTARRSHERG
jgi:hypothetical protein